MKILLISILALSVIVFLLSSNFSYSSESNGVLTLAFDDGSIEHYTYVFPLMKSYGFLGVEAVIVNWSFVQDRRIMNLTQAKEMQNSGWEIASHSLKHVCLTELTEREARRQIAESKDILFSNGIDSSFLVYPFGCYNSDIENFSSKIFKNLRSLHWGYNNLSNINRKDLKSKWVNKNNSAEEVCLWIQEAGDSNQWLILVFHYVGEVRDYFDYPLEEFKKVLKCVKSAEIDVKTVREVLK